MEIRECTQSWTCLGKDRVHQRNKEELDNIIIQCVRQTSKISYPPVFWKLTPCNGIRRPCGASDFFFGYLVAISFPDLVDIWGRLSHFEIVEVMTFPSVTYRNTDDLKVCW